MKYGPFLAIIFAFFLIAIFPYYAGTDEPVLVITDKDGDGITDDKDKCLNETPEEGQDLNEDGCIDKKITKDEIDYLEKISKLNVAQHLFFAIIAIIGGAFFWERKRIRNIFYDDDEFLTDFKEKIEEDKGSEYVDYDKLGEDKVYTEQTVSVFDGFKFSFKDFNAEADRGIQIISLICLVCLLLGPNLVWLNAEGYTEVQSTPEEDDWIGMRISDFNAAFFSDYWEFTAEVNQSASLFDNELWETSTLQGDERYDNPQQCTAEVLDVYNCNYRSSLLGTIEQLLALSALFCFIVFILNFRAEKYRVGIAIFFSLCLVTTMASLLLFTSLIDNAIESDRHLSEDDEKIGTCWMEEPKIWGKTECFTLIDDEIFRDITTYSPGTGFWIILTTISILFVGLFTSIEPLLTMSKRTWTEALKQNWQIFALIFVIFFLWRLNELMSNL